MKQCPHCGNWCAEENQFCEYCGVPLTACVLPAPGPAESPYAPSGLSVSPPPQSRRKSPLKKVLLVFLVLFLLLCLASVPLFLLLSRSASLRQMVPGLDSADLSLQANLSNYGLVVRHEADFYYSDNGTGVFLRREGFPDARIASGYYEYLAVSGEDLFAMECITPEDSSFQYRVVGIDLQTHEKQILYEIPREKNVRALNLIDGKYYFTVNADTLYTLDTATGAVEQTDYRNVIQICPEGVFTTALGTNGLVFLPFDGGSSISYKELADSSVDVLFVEDDTALITAYRSDGTDSTFYMWFLDIHTGALVKILYNKDFEIPPIYGTASPLLGQNKYLIALVTIDESNFIHHYYLYDPETLQLETLWDKVSALYCPAVTTQEDQVCIMNYGDKATPLSLYSLSELLFGDFGGTDLPVSTDSAPLYDSPPLLEESPILNESPAQEQTAPEPEPPELEDFLDQIDCNSLLDSAGIPPLENDYEYTLEPDLCKLEADRYTQAIHLEYAGGYFLVDATLYVDYVYDPEQKAWDFMGASSTEKSTLNTYTFDVEGNWVLEGEDGGLLPSFSLAPGETDLKVLIYDFVPASEDRTYGTFSWVASNLSYTDSLHGEGILTYVTVTNCLQLWFHDGKEYIYFARVQPSSLKYPEANTDYPSYTLYKI